MSNAAMVEDCIAAATRMLEIIEKTTEASGMCSGDATMLEQGARTVCTLQSGCSEHWESLAALTHIRACSSTTFPPYLVTSGWVG